MDDMIYYSPGIKIRKMQVELGYPVLTFYYIKFSKFGFKTVLNFNLIMIISSNIYKFDKVKNNVVICVSFPVKLVLF